MKVETAAEALTMTALETFASGVAVAIADSDSDGGQNRVSGGSGGNSGFGSGR